MKQIEEISKRTWNYTLYRDKESGDHILTVIFFASIDYPRSFYISKLESQQKLAELSEDIRTNYCNYADREIKPPITRSTIAS